MKRKTKTHLQFPLGFHISAFALYIHLKGKFAIGMDLIVVCVLTE